MNRSTTPVRVPVVGAVMLHEKAEANVPREAHCTDPKATAAKRKPREDRPLIPPALEMLSVFPQGLSSSVQDGRRHKLRMLTEMNIETDESDYRKTIRSTGDPFMNSFSWAFAKKILDPAGKYSVRTVMIFILSFCCTTLKTPAQNTPLPINQGGLPSNGVFSGGSIDSVQLNNGNLHVDIPLLHLPGIGMDTDVHFIYDNQVWTVQKNNSPSPAGGHLGYMTSGLWNYEDPLSGYVSEASALQQYNCEENGTQVPEQASYVSSVSFTDGDGTNHAFPISGLVPGAELGCGISGLQMTGYSQDSSGLLATMNSVGDVGSITDKHGRRHIMNDNVPVSVEDTNGNRITASGPRSFGAPIAGTYTLTDTANRSITEVTGPSTGPVTYSTIKYTDQNGATQTITLNYISVEINYPAICSADGMSTTTCSQYDGAGYTASVQSTQLPGSFVLQNGDTYTIAYNSNGFGEISSITLPSGAVISYTYGNWLATGHQVLSRAVTVNGTSSPWSFNYDFPSNPQNSGQVSEITTVTDPNSNATVFTCTLYLPAPLTSYIGIGPPPCYMTKEQIYSGSSTTGTLLATKTTGYRVTGVGMPTSEVFTWNATGQTAETDTQWDPGTNNMTDNISFGNVLSKTVYDFGSGAHGGLLSKTQYGYLFNQNSSYYTANMLDRITTTSVYNSASTLVAQATTAYDQFGQSSINGQGSLVATSGTTQHDYTAYSTANTLRGLPTSTTRHPGPSTPSITSYVNYKDLGQATVATDGLRYSTTFAYGAQNAFVATTTLPVTSGIAHVESSSYDLNTGLLMSQIDQNKQPTHFTYDDRMRPLSISYPDGGLTGYSYPDPNHVITSVEENASTTMTTTDTLDGLGRTIHSSKTTGDSCAAITVDTTYDLIGRVNSVSNPHCNQFSSSDGITTFAYDAISRGTQTVNPDNTSKSWSYSGNAVTFTDEGGNQWSRSSDALGRRTKVLEPNGTSTSPSMETDYTYDANNNLLSVVQWGGASGSSGSRNRTFTYDSLSRLLSAINPETGSLSYTYDANGNVLTKTDARGIKITYIYDALNRLLQKSASDNSFIYSYAYDMVDSTQSNGIGRLGLSSNNVNGAASYSYDPMGRISNRYVCVPGNCTYTLGTWASYDLAGNLITSALADGIQVNETYDVAGRLRGATTSANNPPVTVISNATYGSVGLTQADLGNGLIENLAYDDRTRLNSYSVGIGSSTKYSYGLSFFANGNLKTASDLVNGTWNYTYDTLNRSSTAGSSSTGLQWKYDPFGNGTQQIATLGSAPQPSFTFTTTTNRIDGYCYDAAGNLLDEGPCPSGSIHQFTYDGEGKLSSSGAGTMTYTYDGDGKRIAKSSAGVVSAVYFYDVDGNRVVDTNGAISVIRTEIFAGGRHLATYSGFGTNYNHANWLGTETARTDINGNICETLSGLPFGDAQATSGACSSTPDFYTGKERDSESGNDYFGARYYASSMGRFMSPDYNEGEDTDPVPYADFENPQTLNLYSYVGNNPLRSVDADGHMHQECAPDTFTQQGDS